eukprot:4561115-Pleurochrysis_carterae.AAC.4
MRACACKGMRACAFKGVRACAFKRVRVCACSRTCEHAHTRMCINMCERVNLCEEVRLLAQNSCAKGVRANGARARVFMGTRKMEMRESGHVICTRSYEADTCMQVNKFAHSAISVRTFMWTRAGGHFRDCAQAGMHARSSAILCSCVCVSMREHA